MCLYYLNTKSRHVGKRLPTVGPGLPTAGPGPQHRNLKMLKLVHEKYIRSGQPACCYTY